MCSASISLLSFLLFLRIFSMLTICVSSHTAYTQLRYDAATQCVGLKTNALLQTTPLRVQHCHRVHSARFMSGSEPMSSYTSKMFDCPTAAYMSSTFLIYTKLFVMRLLVLGSPVVCTKSDKCVLNKVVSCRSRTKFCVVSKFVMRSTPQQCLRWSAVNFFALIRLL